MEDVRRTNTHHITHPKCIYLATEPSPLQDQLDSVASMKRTWSHRCLCR